MNKILAIVMVFLVAAVSATALFPRFPISQVKAEETSIFQDDFESYTVGTFPSSPWQMWYRGMLGGQRIVNTAYVSPTQSLRLCGDYQDNVAALAAIPLSVSADVLSYEIMIEAENWGLPSQTGAAAGFVYKVSEFVWTSWAAVAFGSDGNIISGGQVLQPYDLNVWYKIRTAFTLSNRTYSVWVDDVYEGTFVDNNSHDPSLIRAFGLVSDHAEQICYFDDPKVFAVNPRPPETRIVPDDYLTIQGAINAANTGDKILVKAGTYYENIEVNKTVSLIGDGVNTTIIEGNQSQLDPGYNYGIHITAQQVSTTGFLIDNWNYGVRVDADNCIIANNTILINGTLASVGEVHGITIRGQRACNLVDGNRVVASPSYAGPWDYYSAAIWVEGAWYKPGNNVISRNVLTPSYEVNASNPRSSRGVVLASYNYGDQVFNNLISNNGAGIVLVSVTNNYQSCVIKDNIVKNNFHGIELWGSAAGWPPNPTFVYHNDFVNNTQSVQTDGYRGNPEYPVPNVWDDGYPSGGNYWSDYNGTDYLGGLYQNETGSDGIGDIPYVIDASNQDNYPLTHPYGSILNLNTSLSYLTMQSAINAPETLDGHTIYVGTGTYYEDLVISKALSLVGENTSCTIIDGGPLIDVSFHTDVIVRIIADDVQISGLTLRNGSTGIEANQITNLRIEELDILSYFVTGIALSRDNQFVTIRNVNINGPGKSDDLNSVRYGIEVHYSSNVEVSGTNVSCNSIGIEFHGVGGNTVSDCIIKDNGAGVGFRYEGEVTLTRNNLINNTYGMYFFNEYTGANHVYWNNFMNNVAEVSTFNVSHGQWDRGYPLGGNYWSNYNGTDLYHGPYQNETGSDGIGDTAYVIDANNKDSYPLMKALSWSEHDIGITYIGRVYSFDLVVPLKTVVGLHFSLNVSTFVMNYGNQAETFNVQVYANDTLVGTFANVTLTSRESAILTLRWNTTGLAYGNYTVRAVADNLSGETDISDNAYADGTVYVGIPGDINGDDRVDMRDIGYVARRFGTDSQNPLWDPNADLNDDEKIDMLDIGFAARHFGEHYP